MREDAYRDGDLGWGRSQERDHAQRDRLTRSRAWRLIALGAWIALVFDLVMPNPAHAYIDPATTSYLIQVVSGLIITLSVAIGVFFRRIVLWLMTARARLAALWVKLTSPRRDRRREGRGSTEDGSGLERSEAAGTLRGTVQTRFEVSRSFFGTPRTGSDVSRPALDPRYARSIAEVESAARRPLIATGGAARVGTDGAGQKTSETPAPRQANPRHPDLTVSLRTFLWGDRRKFRRRLAIAGPVAVAPAFLLFVFGPLDLFWHNPGEFPFGPGDLAPPMLILFAAAAVLTLGVLLALRGRIFDLTVSLVLGVTLAAWVQGTFLNIDYGELNGLAIRWERYTRLAAMGVLIWIAISVLPVIVRIISRRVWAVAAWLVPTALTLSLGLALMGAPPAPGEGPGGGPGPGGRSPAAPEAPTYDGLFVASSTANQYIFVLDMMDQEFVREIEDEDPDFFASHLDGFTEFDNNLSNYTRTLPSAADMLTGARYQFDEPLDQYFSRAYRESDFLPGLRQAGYSTNIYATDKYSYFNIGDIADLADNVKPVEAKTSTKSMVKGMLRLDAFRYAPHVLKPTFWTSTDQFQPVPAAPGPDSPFGNDNFVFYNMLRSQGVTLDGPQPRFSFIHLNGAHNPATMNRDVRRVPADSVSLAEQARGVFQIMFDFIDELKRVGAYKDASIVITADHGHWTADADAEPLAAPRLSALFVKPAGAEGAPLQHSSAPTQMENVRATLLEDAGVPVPADGPPTVFDLPEDSTTPRDFFYRRGQNVNEGLIDHWRVTGDARDWGNWRFVGETPTQYWG